MSQDNLDEMARALVDEMIANTVNRLMILFLFHLPTYIRRLKIGCYLPSSEFSLLIEMYDIDAANVKTRLKQNSELIFLHDRDMGHAEIKAKASVLKLICSGSVSLEYLDAH